MILNIEIKGEIMKKRIIATLMIGILTLTTLFTGCGRDEKDENAQGDGPWYKAQYYDFTLEEEEYINLTRFHEDSMYFSTLRYIEESGKTLVRVKRMQLSDFSIDEQDTITVEGNGYITDMFVDDTGIYLTLQDMKYTEDYSKLLDAKYEILQYDFDGNKVAAFNITDEMMKKSQEDMHAYISGFVRDEDENFLVTDEESFILVFDKDGNKIADIELNTWGDGLLVAEDGTVYYSYMDDAAWEQMIAPVDSKAGKLGESIGAISNGSECYMDANQRVWTTEDNKLVTFDLPKEEKTVVLNWLDYNVNSNMIMALNVLEDGKIVAFTADYVQESEV